MARRETNIQHDIRVALCKGNTRVFRNNVGMIQGVSFGLHKGSADLIGWETIEITPEMVGQKIARFLSVEVKTPIGKVRKEQTVWLDMVNKTGGRAIIARSVDDVK